MDGSNKRMGNINRHNAAGMGLCVSGLGLLAWPILSQFLGAAREPALLFLAVSILIGLGLIAAGFALMVAGAEPFKDDTGGFQDVDDPE